MVKKIFSLKKHEILPLVPRMYKGRVISQREKKIIEFYENDEGSCM